MWMQTDQNVYFLPAPITIRFRTFHERQDSDRRPAHRILICARAVSACTPRRAGEGSEWMPWLRMLPERVDLPVTGWTDAEVSALSDPDTVREARAVRGLIADSFQV